MMKKIEDFVGMSHAHYDFKKSGSNFHDKADPMLPETRYIVLPYTGSSRGT